MPSPRTRSGTRFGRPWRVAGLVGVVLLGGVVAAGSLGQSIEEPKFTVVRREGDIEIRDYPALVAAEVTVTGDQKVAVSKGFRLLAGYIFGANTRRQKIAMTAPVVQQHTGEHIAMTAPVMQTPSDGAWVVRFTMPAHYTLATLPKPDDPRVTLRPVAPARFAVIRFSGFVGKANVDQNTAALLAFVNAHGLHAVGPAAIAQYNPPWTLWFLRRNEVMIPLAL